MSAGWAARQMLHGSFTVAKAEKQMFSVQGQRKSSGSSLCMQGSHEEGWRPALGARDEGGGHHPRGAHGRRHRRPQLPERTGGRVRGQAGQPAPHQVLRAAFRNVSYLDIPHKPTFFPFDLT